MTEATEAVAVEATLVQPTEVNPRALEVAAQLRSLRSSMDSNFLDICDLLAEAQDNSYHTQFGYSRFEQWVEHGSGLDISARQAFYFVRISKVSKQLNIPREKLLAVGVSKLREIFSLQVEDNTKQIKGLLEGAETSTIDEIKEKVRAIKSPADAQKKFIVLKLDEDVKDIFYRAVELARMNYGSTVKDGEVAEISISKAVELICVEYLQDINNYPEGTTPASFAPDTVA